MNTDHLRAFVLSVDEGTFEAASALLRIAGSAFSQRIKALEREVGQVLVTRTVPVRATPAGEELLRTARQMIMLEDEARRSLGFRQPEDAQAVITLSVAVNADSLHSWFQRVLQEAATWDDVELHLHAEDQEHTHELLRSGTVAAAVTEHPVPVSGCRAVPLGTMRYWPVASAELLERHGLRGPGGRASAGHAARHRDDGGAGTDRLDRAASPAPADRRRWERVPQVDYSIRDSLQRGGLRTLGVDQPRITHLIPSVQAYNTAVWHGLGWGMIPEGMIPPGVMEGTHPDLVIVEEIGPVETALHWQHWTTMTPAMERLTDAVLRGGARMR